MEYNVFNINYKTFQSIIPAQAESRLIYVKIKTMNVEKNNTKVEQPNSSENKSEKELSLSEIDELLKEKTDIFDSLDKFSKDEIFKKENFEDSRITVDKLDDRFDQEVYAKANFWKKFENFTRFGLRKERYDLIKSKDRGLLDKT